MPASSLKFTWLSTVTARMFRVAGSWVPSTITFDSRLNSFVQAKKIDLFFESDKYLFLSQVLIFSKYGFMVWVKLLMFGLGVGMVISCAYVVILMLLFSDSGI